MIDDGILEHTTSGYAAPTVLVRRRMPDGSIKLRIVFDYRALNAAILPQVCVPIHIQTLVSSFYNTKIFTVLDLVNRFWQIRLTERAKQKLAIITPKQAPQPTRAMFGIKTLPATFNKLISRVLGDLDNVCTYVDDIIIHTDTLESHLNVLRQVFQRLEKAKLMVKPSKVSLCKSSVSFLGFILDDKGVSPDPAKIAALVNADPPRTPKQVRQFLGAAGFMRAFIPHFSQIARPLHALTKKDHKFEWTHDCDDAFDLLK